MTHPTEGEIDPEVAKVIVAVKMYGDRVFPVGEDRAALCHAAVVLDKALRQSKAALQIESDKRVAEYELIQLRSDLAAAWDALDASKKMLDEVLDMAADEEIHVPPEIQNKWQLFLTTGKHTDAPSAAEAKPGEHCVVCDPGPCDHFKNLPPAPAQESKSEGKPWKLLTFGFCEPLSSGSPTCRFCYEPIPAADGKQEKI